MLSLRSEVFPDFFSEKFNYPDKIMLIGSCFTENMGKKLHSFKFQVNINPCGILYNPYSVSQTLNLIMEPGHFKEEDLFFYNEKWISFQHHGRFSSTDREEVLVSINQELETAKNFIQQSAILFITFGTAWIYRYKKSGQIVANCHKIPASEFDHFLMTIEEIVEIYSDLINLIHALNNKLKVVFTVSPVRHWKDGPVNNHLSKSILMVAVQQLIEKFGFVSYFPAFEIMMDDLRDYRFYADDLFHPNQTGIDYIWDKFCECFIASEALEIAGKIDKILKAAAHKPFYPKTLAYQKFIESNLTAIEMLKAKYPFIPFEQELNYFQSEKEKYF